MVVRNIKNRIKKKSKIFLGVAVFIAMGLPLELSLLAAISSTFYSTPQVEGYLDIVVPANESKGCLYVKYDENKITPEYFYKAFVVPQRPVVLKGAAEKWPAISKWSDEYLRKKIGHVTVKAIFGNKTDHFGQRGVQNEKYVTFSEFLTLLNTPSDYFWYLNLQKGYNPNKDENLDVRQSNLDIASEYLSGDWEKPKMMKYLEIQEKHFWMGPDGIISRLHTDSSNNILVMLDGSKRFVIFHPDDRVNLYPNIGYQPSFSKMDIDHPDYEKFPKYANAKRYECTAEKGDFLFVPQNWWHQVYSSGRNVAMNFWYKREFGFDKLATAVKIYYK